MRRAVPIVAAAALALVVGCGGSGTETESASRQATDSRDSGIGGAIQDTTGRWQVVVARVGDLEITAEDAYHHIMAAVGPDRAAQTVLNPDMMQVALGSLMDQHVWAEVAIREGFTLTRSEQAQVAAMTSQFLATRYVGDVVQHLADPTPDEVRGWYMENQQNYLVSPRVAAAHIVVATEEEARSMLAELRGGADFRAMARERSLDEMTRDIGGNQGWVEAGKEILGIGRNSVYENAVLPLEIGEYDVVMVGNQWHVVTVLRREGGSLRPLEEVYDEIELAMRRARFGPVYNEALDVARQETRAEFVPEGIERFTGVTQNVERVFEMARQSVDPGQQIELYRRVVFDYPNHPMSPEAQFMIAFLNIKWIDDHQAAKKALIRLETKYGDTEWGAAGRYLEATYLNPDAPTHYGHAHSREGTHELEALIPESPQELLEKASQ